MARRNGGVLLLLGLVIGWWVAEKGWHRHVFYLAVIIGLVSVIAQIVL